ncbi:MAG: Crp/Fnr family transcriptional regulator [bacterium]
MNLEKFLKRVFLFNELSESELKSIASVCSTKRLKKNETLFEEEDAANSFFVVAHGRVKIFKINEKGIEYSIHVNGPGELVAEAAMFNEKRFPASCAALEDTLVVYIPRDAFIALILKRPKLSLKFMSAYSKRLREFVKQVEDLSGSNIKQRLAKYILSNIDKNSSKPKCILSMTKKELSSSLGTIPETLSRALADLKKKAYIETLGKEIIVKDIKGLKSLV